MSKQDGTSLDLDAIRTRVDRATSGPWEVADFNEGEDPPRPLWGVVNPPHYAPLDHEDEAAVAVEIHVGGIEDAEFIAHARDDVPSLLDEIARLRERLTVAETVCTIYGWTGIVPESYGGERAKATQQAYSDWVGKYGSPRPTPEWDEHIRVLAAKRDEIRTQTLARIRGEYPDVAEKAGQPS